MSLEPVRQQPGHGVLQYSRSFQGKKENDFTFSKAWQREIATVLGDSGEESPSNSNKFFNGRCHS
jgi:hypothetical protein